MTSTRQGDGGTSFSRKPVGSALGNIAGAPLRPGDQGAGPGATRLAQAAAPNRLLAACAAALLGTWCLFGGWITLERLASEDEGWYYARPAKPGVVGMTHWWDPEEISALRRILSRQERADGVPWLVLYPSDTPPRSLQYIRAQLAYFEYPLRVDVSLVDHKPPEVRYAGIITPPSLELPDVGEPQVTPEGFRIYSQLQQ